MSVIVRLTAHSQYRNGYSLNGTTVAGGIKQGKRTDQLAFPCRIFLDASGNIFVNDKMNNCIQKWDPWAQQGTTIVQRKMNQFPSGRNSSFSPYGIFVDVVRAVYVAEPLNNCIQKWAPGAITGVTVAGGNGAGKNANQLAFPESVYVDPEGNIYVADSQNNRIQKRVPGATRGVTVAGGNGPGASENQLDLPCSVFVDDEKDIYIADCNNYRIQRWRKGGAMGETVAGGNEKGNSANQ